MKTLLAVSLLLAGLQLLAQTTPTTFRIQAEDHTAKHSAVATFAGDKIGSFDHGEWLEYEITPVAGEYKVYLRFSSTVNQTQVEIRNVSGNVLATINPHTTPNWDTWDNTVPVAITLPSGTQTIRLVSTGSNGLDIDYIQFEPLEPSSSTGWGLHGNSASATNFIGTTNNQPFVLKANGNEGLRVISSGQVGIGAHNSTLNFNDTGLKLFVEGGIRSRKIKIDQQAWADYVFEPSYKLSSLLAVEAFIKKHKHLPDVPSAEEVQANGTDLGEIQEVLLRKIEELTLYAIEQNKKIAVLEKKISKIKAVK